MSENPAMVLANACPRCGYENEPGQRFCGSCGQRLQGTAEPVASSEERRVVTVLFADMVGFTARAEKLDPEDVRTVLASYYLVLRRQIEAFGGTVEKFIGDAVMGVFGAPVAHGDDPERAVRAAIGIVEGVDALTDPGSGERLQVRVGVNTGEALVKLDARLSEGEGMVIGDVVNTAARLQSAASADSILVGEATWRATQGGIDYDPAQTLEVKGKEEPVPAWRVRGTARPPGERARSDVPMVGRERELEALEETWRAAVAEHSPRVAVVTGLPGLGKSRLVTEIVKRVEQGGGRVLLGRSLPYGESSVYDAFAQQIRQLVDAVGGSPEVAVAKLRRRIEELLGASAADEATRHLATMVGLSQADGGGADVANRATLFATASRLIQRLAAERPTMLVFEDVHWADASLLDLIDALTRDVEGDLMVLATARPDVELKRPDWAEGGTALALALEPLGEGHARELVDRLLERAARDWVTQAADQISQIGEGNPLFIEELVASLAERSLRQGNELPTSIRGIIAARLDSIPAPERAVLLSASVVGRVFWDGAVAGLAEGADVAALLASLEERDLVREEPRSQLAGWREFSFKHVLIRDVAYAALPRAKRREAHARVAAFLEEIHAQSERPAVLGHHWLEAGDRARAADYFQAAADLASRGWAKEEAVELYHQTLQLVDESDAERRRELRMKLAIAQQMVFHLIDVASRSRSREG